MLTQECDGYEGDQQDSKPARKWVHLAEVAVFVGDRQQDEVDGLEGCRGNDERPRGRGGEAKHGHAHDARDQKDQGDQRCRGQPVGNDLGDRVPAAVQQRGEQDQGGDARRHLALSERNTGKGAVIHAEGGEDLRGNVGVIQARDALGHGRARGQHPGGSFLVRVAAVAALFEVPVVGDHNDGPVFLGPKYTTLAARSSVARREAA